MLPEGEGFPYQCKFEVSQRIVTASLWQTSAQEPHFFLVLPFPQHNTGSL